MLDFPIPIFQGRVQVQLAAAMDGLVSHTVRCSGGSTKCDNGAIAIDSSTGDIYIGGYTECNLDGNTLTGSRDAFLTKYSSSLVKQCTTLMGVSGQQTETYGAAVLSSGSGKAWFSGKAVGAGGTFGGQTIVGNTRARARPNDDMLPNPEVPDSLWPSS